MKVLNYFKQKIDTSKAEKFFDNPEHQWIKRDPRVLECFVFVVQLFDQNRKMRDFLDSTLFIKSNGTFACAISGDKNIILIYPELISIMKSTNYMQAIAVLLHESGHIILKHRQRALENSKSQIEADLFASELGLGDYLIDFLKDRNTDPQIQERLQALRHVLKKVR